MQTNPITLEQIKASVDLIRTTPKNPEDALKSRRTPPIPVFGDALAFSINDPELVEILRQFQEELLNIIQTETAPTEVNKFWKIQDFFHASFSAHIPPSSADEYSMKKANLSSEMLSAITDIIHPLLEKNIYCTIEEFKLNTDGHIVVRPNIEPAGEFYQARERIKAVLENEPTTARHLTVEASNGVSKQTLGCVVAVIKQDGLTLKGREDLATLIYSLNNMLKGKKFKIDTISWIDWYNRRTCAPTAQAMRVDYTAETMQTHRFRIFSKKDTPETFLFYLKPIHSQEQIIVILKKEKLRYDSHNKPAKSSLAFQAFSLPPKNEAPLEEISRKK